MNEIHRHDVASYNPRSPAGLLRIFVVILWLVSFNLLLRTLLRVKKNLKRLNDTYSKRFSFVNNAAIRTLTGENSQCPKRPVTPRYVERVIRQVSLTCKIRQLSTEEPMKKDLVARD